MEKRWPLIFFLRTGIKRRHSVPSQDYKVDDKSNQCFECSKMQLALSWWKVIRLRRLVGGFPDFLEDNWKTNSCVPLKIDCSALFYWYECNMSSFSEKTGDHLLGSTSYASNFCWIWLILKHPYSRLLFTFGLIRLNPRFITCHDVIDVFEVPWWYFWSISFDQSTRPCFSNGWQIVWDPTRIIFFDK